MSPNASKLIKQSLPIPEKRHLEDDIVNQIWVPQD